LENRKEQNGQNPKSLDSHQTHLKRNPSLRDCKAVQACLPFSVTAIHRFPPRTRFPRTGELCPEGRKTMNDLMTPEQYFAPDSNLRKTRPCAAFTPLRPASLTSREMSLHSAISVHGFTFIGEQQVWYESILERCCALLGRLRTDVTAVAEQPPAVTFIDDAGRQRTHTFDFKFTVSGIGRIMTAVKPSAQVQKSGIDRIVELTAEQISPAIADFTALFTEENLSDVDLFNAEMVNLATRDPCPEDDAALAKCIRKLKGEITIEDLVDKSGLGGCGYDAVVRAVDAQTLRLVEYQKLEFDAFVTRMAKKG
jgi:hypothetical protein